MVHSQADLKVGLYGRARRAGATSGRDDGRDDGRRTTRRGEDVEADLQVRLIAIAAT
jgi:hypothetical protein